MRLIETTDLHLHLLPFDYYTDTPAPGLGLIAAANLIEEARAEADNALLFDNGDFLQGTAMGDYLAQHRGLSPGEEHPVMTAMNALGYDAITLGNHEFNYGIDFLMNALSGAHGAVVSANLVKHRGAAPRADRTLVKPYVLLDRMVTDAGGRQHPIRIGVIGFAPPQVVDWDRHSIGDRLKSRDIVETARAWVPEMREAGADLVIALAHTGIGAAQHIDGMENAAVPLARVPGIDALMTGHSHMVFPSPIFSNMGGVDVQTGTIGGKPAVMAGFWGSHIGLIDMLLVRDGREWRVLGTNTHTRAVAASAGMAAASKETAAIAGGESRQLPPDGSQQSRQARTRDTAERAEKVVRLTASVAAIHEDTRNAIRQPVGHVNEPLHSYFAHLGVTSSLAFVAAAQRRHILPRLADPALAELPVLSSVAPFKCGGLGGPGNYTDVPAGPIALRHIADLYSFPNTFAALRITGHELLEWLERSASAFNRLRPDGQDTLLRDPRVPGYNFEVIYGVTTEYDLSQPARYLPDGQLANPAARRVSEVIFNGAALDPAQEFILCTNSYRAFGAGRFPATVQDRIVLNDGTITRDLIRRHVECADMATAAPPALRFTALPGTHALFETGPGARHHLGQIAHFSPELRGLSSAGFLRLRLDWSSS
ncbi:MAG: 5'-nucleotidase C-terminal domain-containing protein [Pararhodobacter sp.]